jgi:hypothetical protein
MADTLDSTDDVVTALRERMAAIGVSYGLAEHLANMGEASLSKYLGGIRSREFTITSLLRVTKVLGIRLAFIVDEELVRRMQPEWTKRDARKSHARRQPSLGAATLRRVLPAAASEMVAPPPD